MSSNPSSKTNALAATAIQKRAGWWTVATYAALVISIAVAGGIYLRSQLAEARRKVESELNAIADLKVQQIANWRRERFGDAAFFGQATFVARDVQAFLDNPSSAAARAELLRWMTLLKGGDRYARVALFDAKGSLLLMLPDDEDRPGPMMKSHIAEVLRDPRVRMTDLHRGDAGNIHLNLTIPVFAPATGPLVAERASVQPASVQPADAQFVKTAEVERWRVQLRNQTNTQAASPPIAVILLELDPHRFLYPIVQSWPTPSRTAETLLVRRDGDDALFLNELRYQKGTALTLRQPVNHPNLPAAMAARGEVGTREGVDYRGMPVLAAVRAVPDMPWFMVAKVDQEEIYAPLRERAWAAGLVGMMFALAGGLGLMVFWRGRATAHLRHDMMERERSKALLTSERQFLAAVLDNIGEAVVACDAQGVLTRFNQAARELHGLPEKPIPPEQWTEHYDLYLADGKTPLRKEEIPLFRALQGESVRGVEMVVAPKQGEARTLLANAQPMRDASGRLLGAVAAMHDITEQKQAATALRRERDFSDGVLSSLPGVVYCYDESRRFLRWNKDFERVTGYSGEEIARMSPLDFFAGADKELLASRIQEVFDKGVSAVEADFVSKDGTRTPYYFTGLATEIEGRRCLVGVGVDISARKRAEVERDRLFNHSLDMLCVGGFDGFLKQLNPAWEKTLGWTVEELKAKPWLDFVHPDDRAATLREGEQLGRGEAALGFENRCRCKDGSYRWLSWNSFPLPAEGMIFGVVRDITARKRIEAERQKFAMLADSSSEFIGMCDLDMKPLYVNPAGVRMVGLPDMAAACQVKVQDYFFPEDQRFIAEEFFPRVLREGHGDVEIRLRHFQTGEPIWMFYYLFSVRDASGTPVGWATVSRDITERKRADAALRASEQEFRSLAESMPQIVWVTRPDGRNIYFNQQWVDYTGLTLKESYGHGWNKPFHPDDQQRAWDAWQRATQHNATYSLECRLRRADGAYRWWLVRGVPVRDASGKILKWFGTCTDIEDIKQGEAALRESEATVRKKLKAIVEPEGDISMLGLSDIIDIEVMQSMMEDFYRVTGMLGAVLDLSGKVLVSVGWQDICAKFHRCHPDTLKNCIESDTLLTQGVPPGTFKAYHCKNNMCDMVTPLMVGGRHVGNVYFGQFFYEGETPDVEVFRTQARQHGFDETEYLAALDRVPRFSREAVDAGMQFYAKLAKVVTTLSFNGIKQSRMLAEQQRAEAALRQSEAALHALAGRLQRIREEERTRIAREVHDVLGQLLTGLTMDMAWLQKRLPKIADATLQRTMTDKLGEIGELTDSMIQTVQEISSELRPSILDNLGLGPAIQFEAGRFQKRAGIACEVSLPEAASTLEPERATGVFRIFQEILTNVARHAQARRVSIRLAEDAGDLVLEVRDNGKGIPPEQLTGAKSLGVLGMRERAAQLGGRIEFAGEPGKGTTVLLTVPMKSDEE